MKHTPAFIIVLTLFLTALLPAQTLLVPQDYLTIQSAIDDCNDGDEVIIAPGRYTGDGNRDIDFLGKAITVKSESGANTTIIDCGGSSADYHRGFKFHSGETVHSVLDGLTITNGYVNRGGGIYCRNSNPSILNCIITSNKAIKRSGQRLDGGGGIHCHNTRPQIVNCTIIGNELYGVFSYNGHPIIRNCIIWGNIGPEIYTQSAGHPVIAYSDIEGGFRGTGNIYADPCFTNPDHGNYHLLSDSPCINAGDPNGDYTEQIDIDGAPRVMRGRVDMGADEFNHTPIADAGSDQIIYAWFDGFAEITLDGNDSYDPDDDEMTYFWSWIIDGNSYDANGINPVIELPVGEYIIELIVNDGHIDSEPNEVVITVLGPVELLDILAQDVIDLELQQGIENNLLVKLDTALEKLEDDNENNDDTAINSLNAFINAVEAQRSKKITEEDADYLIAFAQEILALFGEE